MKTKFIVMAAMAAMFSMGFTACSNNDEELAQGADRGDAIGFKLDADNSHVTRGLATNSGAIQFTDFQTWGYDATVGGLYMGASATAGKTVSLVSTAWTYSPTQFWPVNPLAFVAIAPAASAEITGNSVAQDGTSKVVTITSGITLDTDVEDQDDIMFAASRAADVTTPAPALGTYGPVARTDHNGDVPLNFQHALSQIVFKGKLPTDPTVTEVEIAEISLGNIPSQGSLTFTSAGAFYGGNTTITPTASTEAVFSLDAGDLQDANWGVGGALDTYSNATAGTAFDLTVSNSTTKPSAKPGNAWFMLPQALTAWSPAAGETKAGALNAAPATGAYLKVRATLKKDGVTILNNTDAVYMPIDQTWERGKKYIYTIEFNGTNALYPITFSVTAEDWVDASPQPGDLSF
jgi:hypothetical protein